MQKYIQHVHAVRFQVHTVASMEMTAFWGIVECILVKLTDNSEVHTASTIRVTHHPDDVT